MDTLRLARDGVEIELAPERGGSIVFLRIGGRDVLRPVAPDAAMDPRGPLETACFPLVPYANRIAGGQFGYAGRTHHLSLNFGDHPHSLHGHGWTGCWEVEKAGDDMMLLSYRQDGTGDWPWAYQVEQKITVIDGGVELVLRLENRSATAMPAGLGFHPYFARPDETRLRFDAKGVWLAGPDLIPDRAGPADALGDWTTSTPVDGDTLIDNCYHGWNGEAIVTAADGSHLRLTASGTPFLQFYRPPGEAFFCLEPVTHMPDAINRPEGMHDLAPGTFMQITMALTAF